MATLPASLLSEEEYLRIDRQASDRSEYYQGEIFAMSGGTSNHSLLSNRIGSLLDRQVRSGCRVYNAEMRIHIPEARTYAYPDGSVVRGDPQFPSNQQDVLLNPILLVEVLSPSSEDYDRGKKFGIYRRIPAFKEYLIVYQDRRCVEHHSKQPDGSWLLREHCGNESSVRFPSVGVEITLADLYAPTIGCP